MSVATVSVREIMRRGPVTVGAEATVRDLIRLLADRSIGGVPVVDRTEKVVGVVSASDVLRLISEWESEARAAAARAPAAEAWAPGLETEEAKEPAGQGKEDRGVEEDRPGGFFHGPDGPLFQLPEALPLRIPGTLLDRTRVRDIMTPATFSVRPEATLPELARFLVGAEIHRALVFEGSELVGIVTSVDVLRAVAGEI